MRESEKVISKCRNCRRIISRDEVVCKACQEKADAQTVKETVTFRVDEQTRDQLEYLVKEQGHTLTDAVKAGLYLLVEHYLSQKEVDKRESRAAKDPAGDQGTL